MAPALQTGLCVCAPSARSTYGDAPMIWGDSASWRSMTVQGKSCLGEVSISSEIQWGIVLFES